MTVKSTTLRQGLRCWTVKHSEHTVNTVKHKDWGVLGNFRQNLRRCSQTLRELCEALQNTIALRFSAKHYWGKIFLLNWFSFSDPFPHFPTPGWSEDCRTVTDVQQKLLNVVPFLPGSKKLPAIQHHISDKKLWSENFLIKVAKKMTPFKWENGKIYL